VQTAFTSEQLAHPEIAEADGILKTCVHYGFCTATCPTYVLFRDENDSPRGRIYLGNLRKRRGDDRGALEEYSIGGIQTNLSLFRKLLADPEYLRGEIHTRWLDEWLARSASLAPVAASGLPETMETAAILAAALFHLSSNGGGSAPCATPGGSGAAGSSWKLEGRRSGLARDPRS